MTHASPQVLRLLDNEAINPDELGDIKVCAAVRGFKTLR
jgi:hypothetical protein